MKAVITVTGRDSKGIIAKVSAECTKYGGNIVDISQSVLSEYFADYAGGRQRADGSVRCVCRPALPARRRKRAAHRHDARGHLQLDAQNIKEAAPC